MVEKNKKNNSDKHFTYNKKKYYYNKKLYNIRNKKKEKPKITNYLHTRKKLKKGIFFKKPVFNDIIYPFFLNLKLIDEYLKKK